MHSLLPTLRANTLFTQERPKPPYQTHHFQMGETSLQVCDINGKLKSLAKKKARKLKLEMCMSKPSQGCIRGFFENKHALFY